MAWIDELGRRLKMRWRRAEAERDLDEEMKLHVALRAEENERTGAPADEARRAARRRFGNETILKEDARAAWGWRWLDALAQDVRYGLRTFRRSPGFTAVAVLALALGIGANTAILSVVNSVLFRPLAYRDADRLVVVLPHGEDPVSPKTLDDWRDQSKSFAALGAAEFWTPNLSGVDQPEQLWALHVSAEIFPLLGVEPLLGRSFRPDEDQPGNDHEVVIGYKLWQRRFGGDAGVVGRAVKLNGESYTVVGVMPASFQFAPFWATRAELWAPIALAGRTERSAQSLRVFARLAPGVSLAQARAEMTALAARLDKLDPGTNRDVQVIPLKEKVVGNVRPALLVLLTAVAFVLLIACANVAHLLLARASARRREIALRRALGAGRGRLVRQFLTESVMLAALGGVAGLLLARLGVDLLVGLGPDDLPRFAGVTLDGGVLLFMLAVSLLAGVAFGLAPALQASAPDLNTALKEGGRGASERGRARSVLVVSQFALALVLLVGAGLMIRTFGALRAVDPGFQPRGVLTLVASVTGTEEVGARRAAFFEELLARVRALPGVEEAGAINHLPLAGDTWGVPTWIEGRPIVPSSEAHRATFRTILPGYFATMRLPLLRGRDVVAADRLDAARVVIVNETLARNEWPGEDPIGKRLAVDDPRDPAVWATVVGVARDARQSDWTEEPRAEVYFPYLQRREYLDGTGNHVAYLSIVVRGAGDPAALAPSVRAVVRGLDENVAVSQVATMEEVVAHANGPPRFFLAVLAAFAGVALVLAAVGIYGVMSYAVSRRTHEIGVRIALGARRRDIFRLVVGQGLGLALAGGLVGLAGALALTRLMRSMLYGVGATDVLTFVAVGIVLAAVALGASALPARRALRIDPMAVLRGD